MISSMAKILIIGSSGQLASELKQLQGDFPSHQFNFTSQADTDVSDAIAVHIAFQNTMPNFVINCAAYTAVDKAETEQKRATEINEFGAQNIAKQALKMKCHLIHISTDFVFDGNNSRPYKEEDSTHPISIYGKSKWKGEEAIKVSGCDYTIIRTSWLYSSFGHNFVKTMMKLGNERESINVVVDQIGSPTYCGDLAFFILSHLEQLTSHKNNIYHYSNEGVASWYDFAYEIMKLNHLTCQVHPIPAESYPTPALRPSYSVMDKSKIKSHYNISIPHWKESLAKCIQLLHR